MISIRLLVCGLCLPALGIATGNFIPAPEDIESGDKTVKLVIMGMRHGSRNPAQFLPNDPNEGLWGLEGAAELHSIGKQQAYSVGEMLRNRYNEIIPAFYDSSSIKAYSSSANRCQMTLQGVLAGLFPPVDRSVWKQGIDWQPIPYTIDNPLLRMYAVDECQPQLDAWQPISDDTRKNLVEWIESEKDVMAYIAKHTNMNKTSLSDIADVADNLMIWQMYDLALPDWIKNPTIEGFDEESMIKKILSFAEAHQIDCALYEPCQNMMAGHWLDHVNDNIQEKAAGSSKRKFIAYTSHTEITLSLLLELGFQVDECPTSAGFVIEYAENEGGDQFVRLFYHAADKQNPVDHQLYVAPLKTNCGSEGNGYWCTLAEFTKRFSKMDSIDDWKDACDIKVCEKSGGKGRRKRNI